MAKQGPGWSNELQNQPKEEQRTVPQDIDAEMKTLTPRETDLAKLAEEAKVVVPQLYDLTSKSEKRTRVIHDHKGVPITIPPGETKQGVLLRPDIAKYLNQGDLSVTLRA